MATEPNAPKIGFVGLGVMGRPMAAHLVAAGFSVTCFNRSTPAMAELRDKGAVVAADLADLAANSDVVITMLPDAPDVEQVLFDGGVADHLSAGATVIDCSTISPHAAVSIGERLAAKGIGFVDAPVSGGEVGAVNGTLAVMLGGQADAVEVAMSVLEPVASVMVHVGAAGSGQTVKAANQLLVAGNLALIGEALLVLEGSGVDVDSALRVLGGGLAASRCLEVKSPAMARRDFRPGFRINLHHKDLQIALAAAAGAGVAVPVTGLVAQLVAALRASGDGDLDHGALIDVLARMSSPGRISEEP